MTMCICICVFVFEWDNQRARHRDTERISSLSECDVSLVCVPHLRSRTSSYNLNQPSSWVGEPRARIYDLWRLTGKRPVDIQSLSETTLHSQYNNRSMWARCVCRLGHRPGMAGGTMTTGEHTGANRGRSHRTAGSTTLKRPPHIRRNDLRLAYMRYLCS